MDAYLTRVPELSALHELLHVSPHNDSWARTVWLRGSRTHTHLSDSKCLSTLPGCLPRTLALASLYQHVHQPQGSCSLRSFILQMFTEHVLCARKCAGHCGETKQISSCTHGVPSPLEEQGETSIGQIIQQMSSSTGKRTRKGKFTILRENDVRLFSARKDRESRTGLVAKGEER